MQRLIDTGLIVLILATLAAPGTATPKSPATPPAIAPTAPAQPQASTAIAPAPQPLAPAAPTQPESNGDRDRLMQQYRWQVVIPAQD